MMVGPGILALLIVFELPISWIIGVEWGEQLKP